MCSPALGSVCAAWQLLKRRTMSRKVHPAWYGRATPVGRRHALPSLLRGPRMPPAPLRSISLYVDGIQHALFKGDADHHELEILEAGIFKRMNFLGADGHRVPR